MSYFELYCIFTLLPALKWLWLLMVIVPICVMGAASLGGLLAAGEGVAEKENVIVTKTKGDKYICQERVDIINEEHLKLEKKQWSVLVKYVVILIISILMAFLIPSKKDMLTIVGLKKMSEVKGINQLPTNLVSFLNHQLKKETAKALKEKN